MRLGEAGATLVVNGHCSDEKIIAAIKKYQANGITTHDYRFDVTVETAVEAVVANIEKEVGPIDCLTADHIDKPGYPGCICIGPKYFIAGDITASVYG